MAKALCIMSDCSLKSRTTIYDISVNTLGKYPRIVETQINTKYWNNKPLEKWKIDHDNRKKSKVEGLEWWKAYTDAKHNEKKFISKVYS